MVSLDPWVFRDPDGVHRSTVSLDRGTPGRGGSPLPADALTVAISEQAMAAAPLCLALAAVAALLWLVVLPGELLFFLVWR
jgi:hypothetical protein